jgi:hypothetical protein
VAPGSSILFYFQMCDLAKPAIIKRIGSSLQLGNSLKLTSHTTFLWTTNPFSPEVQAQHQLHWANWNPHIPRCSSGHRCLHCCPRVTKIYHYVHKWCHSTCDLIVLSHEFIGPTIQIVLSNVYITKWNYSISTIF